MASGIVLLVSDDAGAGQVWASFLFRDGLEGIVVESAREALERWEKGGFDLGVLDLPLQPEGLDLCRALRARASSPILLLCPSTDEAQSVAAYAAGADECIPKPVSPAILQAKLRAWLRHGWTIRAESLRPLEVGGLRLEPRRRQVRTPQGAAVPLTALELRLLYVLMSHPGQALAPELLASRMWGPENGGNPRLVRHLVHHLRQKIEPNPCRPRIIRTVRGQGYAYHG